MAIVNLSVEVNGGGVDYALKLLKRRLEHSGFKDEIKTHQFYMKPSERRNLKSRRARKRARTKARERIEYEKDESYKPNHNGWDYVTSPNYKGTMKWPPTSKRLTH